MPCATHYERESEITVRMNERVWEEGDELKLLDDEDGRYRNEGNV